MLDQVVPWRRPHADEGVRATQARSGRERSPAATRLGGLGIHEDKALLHQRFLIVQDHAIQLDERLRVHEHAHIVELENTVPFAGLRVEADVVA